MRSSHSIELLEMRLLLAADTRLAVIGDYGVAGQAEQDVARLVKSWAPDLVLTVGDNNYPDGAAASIDANVGQYYHDFIYPYGGSYGAGAADGQNHFWPILGNHDWDAPGATPYIDYFSLPNNERYYAFERGNVAFFMIDSDPNEPDGNTADSVQGQWIRQQMLASTARWKLVLSHHPVYSSGINGSTSWMAWPLKQWGATAILSGHDHDYERLEVDGVPYFVDGVGGDEITPFQTPVAGSQIRYNADYGAMLITANDASLSFDFVTRTGKVIDHYSIGGVPVPAAPTALEATPLAYTQIGLRWRDNASDESGYRIERSADGIHFNQIAWVPTNTTFYSDTTVSAATSYNYRVAANNSGGDSQYSNIAAATTLDPAGVIFLSDANWDAATNGWGPVERDMTNGGPAGADGGPINLNGVTYLKGLGCHAFSQILYSLAGRYSIFSADMGIDESKGDEGSVVFQVLADGVKIYESGIVRGSSPTQSVNVNVTNVRQLALVVTDAGDGIDVDHADWAAARLTLANQTPTSPAAPTALSASATSSSQISLSWIDNAINETAYEVERSTNGVDFAQIALLGANTREYIDPGLIASTTYFYRVRAANGVGFSAYSNTASAQTPSPASFVYLSDLAWSSATNGWGPVEKDMSNGSSGSRDGRTITLNGVTYAKGLGCHANSRITYDLAGIYDTFASDIGVDDEEGSGGSVVFQLIADGVTIYSSGMMTGASATRNIITNITGVRELALVVSDAGDGIDMDHADWAAARLTLANQTPTSPAAPTALSASATSSSQISLSWIDNAINETAYEVERSTNGVDFAQIALLGANTREYIDPGLIASTTYFYRVRAANGVGFSAYSNTASAQTPSPASFVYLSELTWSSATNGSGPVEKDMSNGGTGARDGRTITLNGVTYSKGLGVNANSKIVYNLGGKYSGFVSDIGVDDEVGDAGSVVFQVLVDGKIVYNSGLMRGSSATRSLSIAVSRAKQLTLIVNDAKDGKILDHADWAGARLILSTAASPLRSQTASATTNASVTHVLLSSEESLLV